MVAILDPIRQIPAIFDLGLPIRKILTIFDPKVIMMLPTKSQVNWPFDSELEVKNRFSRWRPRRHLGFPIGIILAIFDQQVTPMLPTVLIQLAFQFKKISKK